MTRIYLITGFLGAGKTTFLNYRLNRTKVKVGVLMNEFGKISMDTIAVKNEDMDFIELKNGSIFCACLKDYFIEGLTKLVDEELDEIYIEGSGLADPSDMGKVMEVIGKLARNQDHRFEGTICIVDGVFFEEELKKMVSVERQIKHSHHVLINKMDLISEKRRLEIEALIKDINPKIKVTPVAYGEVDFADLHLESFYIEDEETTNTIESKPRTLVIRFMEEPRHADIEKFLDMLTEDFHRIKGYLWMEGGCVKVDSVNSIINFEPYPMDDRLQEICSEVEGYAIEAYDHGFNELVCLSSTGIRSVSKLSEAAKEQIGTEYKVEM